MFDRIKADLKNTYSFLHQTIYSLLIRGDSLKSIIEKSEELELYALEMEIKGKMVREQIQIDARIRRRRRNHFFCLLAVVSLCTGGGLYSYSLIKDD